MRTLSLATRMAIFAWVAMAGAGIRAPAAESRPLVDRVEVKGVTVFESAAIEAVVEIAPGDPLERERIVKTAQNIRGLYNVHGYEQARVSPELTHPKGPRGKPANAIEFTVSEGLPTRVSSLSFSPVGGARRQWGGIESELHARLAMGPGDVFDQDKIAGGKRNLTDALASEEYVGARIDDVRVTSGEPPAGPAGQKPAARWVNVEIRVDLGDKVSFGFRGNVVMTRSRLLALIEEQRLIGFGKDYIGAIRARIEEEYRGMGYANARAVPYTFENAAANERHVPYQITEGQRVPIQSIDFEGNLVFTAAQLREAFYARASTLVNRDVYVDRDVEKAAELLVEWMKSQGYLAAKLVTINRIADPRTHAMKLVIYLYEGDQTILESVRFEGVTVFSQDELRRTLGLAEGAPLNLFAFSEGLELLKAAYRARGYLDVKILNESDGSIVRYSQENRVADIHVQIAEGRQYRVSKIEIEGLTETHEEIVTRELALAEGDILEEGKLNESEARIRRLGVFSGVTIRTVDDPQNPSAKIVRVSIQEGTPGVVGGGIGFRNDLGLRLFGQTTYANLWHRNHTISLTANVNRRFDEDFCDNRSPEEKRAAPKPADAGSSCIMEYQAQLGYRWPYVFWGDTTFRPRITAEQTQYVRFDAQTLALAASLERPFWRALNLVGVLTYSLERVRQFSARAEEDQGLVTIGGLTPAIRVDLRDNPLSPTRGFFGTASYEFASPAFLSQPSIGYTRFQLRSDYYVPVSREITWFLSFRTGFGRNYQSPPEGFDPRALNSDRGYQIPLIKQFTLGGAGSLRGYKEQDLNLQSLRIQGTMSYVNYRTQVDLPFSGPLRFGPFLDAGNLNYDTFSFGNLRYGAGVGFHYQSPVGPVNFDWGYKLNPPTPEEDRYRFYFSIGVI
jgi:outer membrane protein insertion porin family